MISQRTWLYLNIIAALLLLAAFITCVHCICGIPPLEVYAP
jgi:hypothetical protein